MESSPTLQPQTSQAYLSIPHSIDLDTPLLDIFLLKLKLYFGNDSDPLCTPLEFQTLWHSFKDDCKAQLRRIGQLFLKPAFEEEELEYLSRKLCDRTGFQLGIRNLSPQEEFESLMKRAPRAESSGYIEKRLGFLSSLDGQVPKKVHNLSKWVSLASEFDSVGLIPRKPVNAMTSQGMVQEDLLRKEQRKTSLKRTFFAFQDQPVIKKVHNEEAGNASQIKVTHDEVNFHPRFNKENPSMEIDWVKFRGVLFCRTRKVNRIFFEFAPISILKLPDDVLEELLNKGVVKCENTMKGKTEKGVELEDFLEEIKEKFKSWHKINGILLSFIGRAKNEMGKVFTIESRKQIMKKWVGHLKNTAKRAIFGSGMVKVEAESEGDDSESRN